MRARDPGCAGARAVCAPPPTTWPPRASAREIAQQRVGRVVEREVGLAFTAYSFTVLGTHGLVELVAVHRQGGWSVQIFLDLVISLAAFWIVAVPDARARGIRVWPYLVATPLVGSIAALAYFVHRSLRSRPG